MWLVSTIDYKNLLLCIQRLFNICNDIIRILDTNRETDQVGTYTGFHQLFVRKLTVRMAGGVQHAGAGIGYVGDDSCQFQ